MENPMVDITATIKMYSTEVCPNLFKKTFISPFYENSLYKKGGKNSL
jgi:hypothetical protein